MKFSLTVILAVVAFAYSTGCVLYHEIVGSISPASLAYPLAPGIWVGAQVRDQIGETMHLYYIAGIGTMTLVGAVLGSILEWFLDLLRQPTDS